VKYTRSVLARGGKVQTADAESEPLGVVHLNKFNAGIFILPEVLYDIG
jgi:hypothetical protein